jgi:hypothetical protein
MVRWSSGGFNQGAAILTELPHSSLSRAISRAIPS